jgi:hypothetical protein
MKGDQGIELGLLVTGRISRISSSSSGSVDEIYETNSSSFSSCKKFWYRLIALVGIFLVGLWHFSTLTSSKPLFIELHDDCTTTEVHCDGVGMGDETHESHAGDENKGPSFVWNLTGMTMALATARADLEAKMRVNYGDFYDTIFFENGVSVGRSVMMPGGCGHKPPQISTDRFQRKLIIKLLQVQRLSSSTRSSSAVDSGRPLPVSFVWATGGEGLAAGYGNLFNESFSSVLEQATHDVFAAVGINFVVRNYAMEFFSSALESALCSKEIFGKDIDLLLWDYGSMYWVQELFHWRAALLKEAKPVHIMYQGYAYTSCRGDDPIDSGSQLMRNMQDLGFASFMSNGNVIRKMVANIPDSSGLSETEQQALPPFVRNYRCAQHLEYGNPQCVKPKFSHPCQSNGWYSGWKWHALKGYFMSLFIIEVLDDAVKELVRRSDEDPATLLSQLLAEENADYVIFERAEVPSMFQKSLPPSGQDGFDIDLFINGNSICHTARLPAEIRFKGILTETNQTGFYLYDRGVEVEQAKKTTSGSELMRLVYTAADRKYKDCPLEMLHGERDFFYVDSREGWKKLVVPNDSSLKEYGNGQPLQGLVVFCFADCEYGVCPSGSHRRRFPIAYGIQVNNVAVTDLWTIGESECSIVRNERGYRWTPNTDGRFEVQFRVKDTSDPGSFLQVSSIIVY